jgi:stage II sporulation protein M
MDREEDHGLQGKGEGVQIENPDEGTENIEYAVKEKDYAVKEKDFTTANTEAKTWQGGRKNSRKAEFTEYVLILWPYLVIIIFVFFGSLLTGYASAASFPDMANTLMKGFSSRFAPLLTMSPLYILLMIFLNNAFVSLVSLILGIALGVFPILFIASNGYFVGVISYIVGQQKGFLFILLALLPHGVIELPMVFLSASIGLRLGHQVFLYLIGKPTEVKREFVRGLKFYFLLIVPLLFFAAIIETFITPLILSFVKGP